MSLKLWEVYAVLGLARPDLAETNIGEYELKYLADSKGVLDEDKLIKSYKNLDPSRVTALTCLYYEILKERHESYTRIGNVFPNRFEDKSIGKELEEYFLRQSIDNNLYFSTSNSWLTEMNNSIMKVLAYQAFTQGIYEDITSKMNESNVNMWIVSSIDIIKENDFANTIIKVNEKESSKYLEEFLNTSFPISRQQYPFLFLRIIQANIKKTYFMVL